MWGHLYEPMRDPEGLLSTLPAIAGTLFGVAVGEWIRTLRAHSAKLLRRLVAAGLACFLAGELWSLIFPINKKLWTSSYVLLTVGLAMLSLAACYWLMDVKKLRGRWTIVPIVFGTNCIFAYAFSELAAASAVVFTFRFGGNLVSSEDLFKSLTVDNIAQPQYSALAFALFYAAFCWFFTWLLYRRKIFLKI
jgi:predicted acyltransferase